MKIFQILQENCAAIGIIPLQDHQMYRINLRNMTVVFMFIAFFVSYFGYILLKVETFSKYLVYFYNYASALNCGINFVVVIVKMRKVFRLISNLENYINNRKSCSYTENTTKKLKFS